MKDMVCILALVGVALAAVGCGGGGGGGRTMTEPPACTDQGISVQSTVTPRISQCTTDNPVAVTVSNQSCTALTVNSIDLESVQIELCPSLDPLNFTIGQVVPAQSSRRFDLVEAWCCTDCPVFSCEWRHDVVVHTAAGDFRSTSGNYTKNFSEVCQDCPAEQGTGPAVRAVAAHPL